MMSTQPEISALRIAVILPCFNEEATIAQVIKAFAQHLPHADIYVCDNASQDKTAEQASAAGAIVLSEHKQGKANAVNRLFSAVDADVYVLSDGDLTYDASAAPQLITALIENKCEMIVGTRTPVSGQKTYRPGHSFGNFAFTTILRSLFGGNFSDVLSGYRVFSRAFVKSMPIMSRGFDIEVEMTVHALATGQPVAELSTAYSERPEGSVSKLSTFKDGFRIGLRIIRLIVDFRPLTVFGVAAIIFGVVGLSLFYPVWLVYLDTGLVSRFPTAFLSLGLGLLSILSLLSGLILDGISRQRLEMKKLAYLSQMLKSR
jgi:glycosyltransferase involved in cell wall biosynthesis